MVDRGFAENELAIDWDHLLENIPDDPNFDFCARPIADGFSNLPDSGCSLSMDDIEQYLLNVNDEGNYPEEKDQTVIADEFFSDVFLDSVPWSGSDGCKDCSTSPESVGVGTDEEKKGEDRPQENGSDVPKTKEKDDVAATADDSTAKKRKRQIRNRDAAVRSRERKKMYVRDLEMKSKFYEAECKRLGILLQCCLSENQALRLSLHNSKAFDVTMTRQESAVLLLESLLLGSLLGFLGIISLLVMATQFLSTLEAGLVKNVGRADWESEAPRRAGNNVFRVVPYNSFMMGKRCRASRSRIKIRLSTAVVIP